MRGVAVVCALGLFVFALVSAPQKARAQTVELCYGQSFDVKYHEEPPDNFFYKAVSYCPLVVNFMDELTELYQYNWDDGLWYLSAPLGADAQLNAAFLGDSGFVDAPGYLGAACYSAWRYWAAVDFASGQVGVNRTASPGRCY